MPDRRGSVGERVRREPLPAVLAGQPLVWIGSSSTRGGAPPFLAPYSAAAKAALDALAVSCAGELVRFGVDTAIVVPGAYPSGTHHFAHAGHPADPDRAVADRIRVEFFRRIGLDDLLTPGSAR
ncbi:hypothetical protein [Modestobacter altitudinis]|uniref:hypothetical protein n=1 Tax=Modestobacter altitudinis TaxID=2213158 RepID=UPI001C5537D3|nr:hypothetical protein [Modestobacter altitudinis]